MRITIFNKEIELDENNEGIKFYLNEMCEPIDEVITVFWRKLRISRINDNYTSKDAASDLRKMTADELKQNVLDNIKCCLRSHAFSKPYAKYIIDATDGKEDLKAGGKDE